MTTAFFKKSLIAAAVTLASTQTFAAAFQLNEHSASGLGRAYAGEAAIADNAAVLSRNPAAMTTFDKMALSVSGTYIKPDVEYLFTRTGLTASVLPGWDNLSSRCTP